MIKKLTDSDLQRLKVYFNRKEKIKAIKYIRGLTGFGLKKSKGLIDNYFYNAAFLDNFEYEVSNEKDLKTSPQTSREHAPDEQTFMIPNISESDLNTINQYLQKRQKIRAVKLVKEKLGISLTEAKYYIDNFKHTNKQETKSNQTNKKQNKAKTSKQTFKKEKRKPFSIDKMNRRDKKRDGTKSNSGCMVMLSLMLIIGIIITGSILYI